jgi:hypothetical protein
MARAKSRSLADIRSMCTPQAIGSGPIVHRTLTLYGHSSRSLGYTSLSTSAKANTRLVPPTAYSTRLSPVRIRRGRRGKSTCCRSYRSRHGFFAVPIIFNQNRAIEIPATRTIPSGPFTALSASAVIGPAFRPGYAASAISGAPFTGLLAVGLSHCGYVTRAKAEPREAP